MAKVTPSTAGAKSFRQSVEWIRDAVLRDEDLVLGLATLRDLGPGASTAVDQAFTIPEVEVLRRGWELLEVLAAIQGVALVPIFDEVLGAELGLRVRYALFGA